MESLYSYTSKKDDYTERGVPTNTPSQRQRLSPKVDYSDVVPLVPAQAVAVEYELAHRRPRPRPPATVFHANDYHKKRDDYYGGGNENSMDYPSPHAPDNHHTAVAPLPPPEEYFMSSSPREGDSMTLDQDYPSYVPDQWKSNNKTNVSDGEVGDEYDRLDDMAEDMAEWAWIDHSSSRRCRSVAPAYPSERVMLASIGVLGCALAGPLLTCVGLGAAYVFETATAHNKPSADAEAEATTANQSKKQAKKNQRSLPMTALVGRHPAATSFEVVVMTSSMLWMSMCDAARRHRLAERSWNGMCQAGSWTWYHMRQLVLPPPPQPKPQMSAAAALWNSLRCSSLAATSRRNKKQQKQSEGADAWSRTQEMAVRSCAATSDLLYNHVIIPSVQGIRTLTRPAPTRSDANKTSPNSPLKQTNANYENTTKTVINYDQSAKSEPKQTNANQQIKKPVLVAAVCG